MKYTVFVISPVKIEINAANEEEAKKKVFDIAKKMNYQKQKLLRYIMN